MSAPHDAPYKVEQREAKASKRSYFVTWVAGQGTYRKPQTNEPKGKATVKAARRSGKVKGYYLSERKATACDHTES